MKYNNKINNRKGKNNMSMVFLYRVKNSDDRDCCAYIENTPLRFECGHYFGRVFLHGSCYCNSDWKNYDEIETVLTESEYNALRRFDSEIENLGYGIKKDSERYAAGMELCENIKPVYEKLNSEEGQAFYQKIVAEEKQVVMDEYDMTEDQANDVFENYPFSSDYQDRSIVGAIFDSIEDLGYEEAVNFGYINHNGIIEQYFDFEQFGHDLVNEGETYHEINDGRCIFYMM